MGSPRALCSDVSRWLLPTAWADSWPFWQGPQKSSRDLAKFRVQVGLSSHVRHSLSPLPFTTKPLFEDGGPRTVDAYAAGPTASVRGPQSSLNEHKNAFAAFNHSRLQILRRLSNATRRDLRILIGNGKSEVQVYEVPTFGFWRILVCDLCMSYHSFSLMPHALSYQTCRS